MGFDTEFLTRGRSFLEARMADTCRVTRSTGRGPIDPTSLKYTETSTVLYEGPCRIPRIGAVAPSLTSNGESSWQVGEYPLVLPYSAAGTAEVKVGDVVLYLTSADDPELEDQVFGITGLARQSQSMERRFRMRQIVGGGRSS